MLKNIFVGKLFAKTMSRLKKKKTKKNLYRNGSLEQKKVVIGIMKFISIRKNVMKFRGGLHSSSSALLCDYSSHGLMKNLKTITVL